MKYLAFVLLSLAPAFSQQLQPVTSQQADCGKFSTPVTAAGTFNTAIVDNRQAACDGWVVTYSSNSFATVSVLLQSAPLGLLGIPGTFVSFAGTITQGPNPAVLATQSEIRATGYFPYVRVQITTTGAGYLTAEFHGFKSNPNSGSGATGGCPGTQAKPCVVVGPEPAFMNPTTTNPVQVAGLSVVDQSIANFELDASGFVIESQKTIVPANYPDGQGTYVGQNLGNASQAPVIGAIPLEFNGATWDKEFVCASRVRVRLTDATRTALVAPSGSTVVRICHIHATTDGSSENFTITQGTGAACVGGTATIDSVLNQLGFAFDFQPTAALRSTAANGICIAQSGGAQNADVTAIYAQF